MQPKLDLQHFALTSVTAEAATGSVAGVLMSSDGPTPDGAEMRWAHTGYTLRTEDGAILGDGERLSGPGFHGALMPVFLLDEFDGAVVVDAVPYFYNVYHLSDGRIAVSNPIPGPTARSERYRLTVKGGAVTVKAAA